MKNLSKCFKAKPKLTINTVKGLKIGELFLHDGNLFKVTKFPTRSIVCGDIVHAYQKIAPQSVKVPLRECDIDMGYQVRKWADWSRKQVS